MSELLEEARERRDKAELSTESPSYNWLNDSYYLGEQNAWREAVDLIEKHEKPKGLLQVMPSAIGRPLAKVTNNEAYIKTELTEEQQEVYNALLFYYTDQKGNIAATITNALYMFIDTGEEHLTENDNFTLALKKFLSEVEE